MVVQSALRQLDQAGTVGRDSNNIFVYIEKWLTVIAAPV